MGRSTLPMDRNTLADYLDRHPDADAGATNLALLATSIANNLLQERDRRVVGARYISAVGNLAQVTASVAQQGRRLEPAWALPR